MTAPAPVPTPTADCTAGADADPAAATRLSALAAQARAELAAGAYPDRAWVQPAAPALPTAGAADEPVWNVLIVGAGQSGLGLCARLQAGGVTGVLALDRAPAGHEGVWERFARMPELRTPKALNGLDMGQPSLSVQRWYRARFGDAAWDGLGRIPRTHWADYLRWYRDTLALPVDNGVEVLDLRPVHRAGQPPLLALDTLQHGQRRTRLARLVVLATGTEGGGAWRVPPAIAQALPPGRCHHSSDDIDFAALRGQRVAVLGHGAAAFDSAVAALQAGASSVDLCFRRARLPRVNPHRHIETAGLMSHYARLPDAVRWSVARHFQQADQPPAEASFRQALAFDGFRLHAGAPWRQVRWCNGEVHIDTPRGTLVADHVVCATGTAFDLAARPELRTLAPRVARWRDRYTPPPDQADDTLADHPYLGEHYEFLPREVAQGAGPVNGDAGQGGAVAAAWVSRVFAFNGSSIVSQGPHSTSISGHKHALPRLAHGVSQRLFLDQQDTLVDRLHAYDEPDLDLPDGFEAAMAARADAVLKRAMETP